MLGVAGEVEWVRLRLVWWLRINEWLWSNLFSLYFWFVLSFGYYKYPCYLYCQCHKNKRSNLKKKKKQASKCLWKLSVLELSLIKVGMFNLSSSPIPNWARILLLLCPRWHIKWVIKGIH